MISPVLGHRRAQRGADRVEPSHWHRAQPTAAIDRRCWNRLRTVGPPPSVRGPSSRSGPATLGLACSSMTTSGRPTARSWQDRSVHAARESGCGGQGFQETMHIGTLGVPTQRIGERSQERRRNGMNSGPRARMASAEGPACRLVRIARIVRGPTVVSVANRRSSAGNSATTHRERVVDET